MVSCLQDSPPLDYIEWLIKACDGKNYGFPSRQQYEAIKQSARQQYEAIKQSARQQYEAIEQPARQQYEAIKQSAWQQYEAIEQPARQQYEAEIVSWLFEMVEK